MLDEGAHAGVLRSGIILGDYEEGRAVGKVEGWDVARGAGERCEAVFPGRRRG